VSTTSIATTNAASSSVCECTSTRAFVCVCAHATWAPCLEQQPTLAVKKAGRPGGGGYTQRCLEQQPTLAVKKAGRPGGGGYTQRRCHLRWPAAMKLTLLLYTTTLYNLTCTIQRLLTAVRFSSSRCTLYMKSLCSSLSGLKLPSSSAPIHI
jgi:hypothetical protein